MFVLLIGLMGVGALIPAGRYEIMQGVKMDYGTMIGRSALRNIKTRGYMDRTYWRGASGKLNTPGWLGPVVFDPLGIGAGFGAGFPFGAAGPQIVRVSPLNMGSGPAPTPAEIGQAADPIFRCANDLIVTPNANTDLPPSQAMMGAGNKRASVGNYSWFATVVPPPNNSSYNERTVSVAVLYKRDLSSSGAGESTASIPLMPGGGIGGGEVLLNTFSTNPPKLAKPGQWIMLAGVQGGNTSFKWYRVVAAADIIRT